MPESGPREVRAAAAAAFAPFAPPVPDFPSSITSPSFDAELPGRGPGLDDLSIPSFDPGDFTPLGAALQAEREAQRGSHSSSMEYEARDTGERRAVGLLPRRTPAARRAGYHAIRE